MADALRRRDGQGTQRIAVQIDDAIRHVEQGLRSLEIGHRFSPVAHSQAADIRTEVNCFKLKIYKLKAFFRLCIDL